MYLSSWKCAVAPTSVPAMTCVQAVENQGMVVAEVFVITPVQLFPLWSCVLGGVGLAVVLAMVYAVVLADCSG